MAIAQNQSTSRSIIPGLDGIRAIAVLTVFVFHAEILPHIPGELATTIFFFLSGFLITTLFVKEWKKTGTLDLGAFYKRRALRTLPPLYIVLGLAILAHSFLRIGQPVVAWKAMGNVFQYTNYAITGPLNTDGFLPGMVLLWSLAVDEHYYLLFAPLFRSALKRFDLRKIVGFLIGLCGLALLWRLYLVHAAGEATFRVSMASDTRMDSILWGAILALWRNPWLEPEKAKALAKPLPVIAAVVFLLLPSFSGNDAFKTTFGYTLEGLALIPLFSLAILHSQRGALKFLNSPILIWVSRASYPIYLFQWLVLEMCRQYVHKSHLVQALIAFAATIVLSAALHYSVERPLMALRKKSQSKPDAVPAAGHELSLQPAPAH